MSRWPAPSRIARWGLALMEGTLTTTQKRLAILSVFCLGAPGARAQDVTAASFDQLRLVARLGDTMTVTEASGTTITGKLAALSASELTLLVGHSRRHLDETNVRTIARHGHADLGQGARWGFGIGGCIGLLSGLYWANECNGCGALVVFSAATYAALGAGIGVGFAAITPTRSLIYSVTGDVRRKVVVSPIATPGRFGGSLSVTF